jgi:hypothetical protein
MSEWSDLWVRLGSNEIRTRRHANVDSIDRAVGGVAARWRWLGLLALRPVGARCPPIWAENSCSCSRRHAVSREILASDRWRRLAEAGAQPQRLLWASTGTKDPALPAGYYLTALAAEGTVNTVPEKTLRSFAESGAVEGLLDTDTAEADAVVEAVGKVGIDVDALAAKLQADGRDSFVQSWNALLACIESKRKTMRAA